MKKENRLLKNKEFKAVLDARNSKACNEYVVYLTNSKNNYARFGISVSSKIGNSVIRHKIKRQINEMIRKSFDMNTNVDVVIIVRSKYLNNDFSKNKDILLNLLYKFFERSRKNEKN